MGLNCGDVCNLDMANLVEELEGLASSDRHK